MPGRFGAAAGTALQDSQNPYGAQARGMIGGAQQAGFFNPMGSPQIMEQTRRNALRNSDNARRRSALLSRLMGLDPNQARVAAVNQDAESSRSTQDALQGAQLQQSLGNQDWFRSLFSGQLGLEQQKALAKYMQQLQGGGAGAALGSLLGTGAGAFLGGPGGAALGNRLVGR